MTKRAQKPAARPPGATELLEHWLSSPDRELVEQILKGHPGLTRAEVEEHLAAAGF